MIEDLKFVSDPMSVGRHILELNATNNAVVRRYVWGLDLSGSLDGTGGVGGWLWVTMNSGPAAGTHFAAYDGNGNVVGLINAATGTETVRYEYGPFGEPIRVTGPASRANPFRFSTKRADDTTDLVLYEYRAYSSSLGQWLSRDPIGENGGLNLYGYVANAPVWYVDAVGQWYDSITAYYESCAVMHSLGSRPYCECVCAPVTTGAEDSQSCVNDCTYCANLLSTRGSVDAHGLCLCGCMLANKKAAKKCKPVMDCTKVCWHLAPRD